MLGDRLRELRRARKMSQVELAVRAALSQSYISRLEKGVLVNPATDVVRRLAEVLDIDVARLYARGPAESVVLKAELHTRIEAAVRRAGDDLERAELLGCRALDEFVAAVEPEQEAIAEWGGRLLDSHLALARLALAEQQAPSRPEVSFAPERQTDRLPDGCRFLIVERDGLLPGVHRGDLAFYTDRQEVRDGDLALVELESGPCIRRVYFLAPGPEVLLVHPGAQERSERADRSRIRGRVAGTLFSSGPAAS